MRNQTSHRFVSLGLASPYLTSASPAAVGGQHAAHRCTVTVRASLAREARCHDGDVSIDSAWHPK